MPPDEQTVLHLHRRQGDIVVDPGVEKKEVLSSVEIKDFAKGEVEAVFATLYVVDKDRDVIVAGAIKEGAKMAISDYGHSVVFGDKPVGKGEAHVEDNKALVRGRYFLKTTNGMDSFTTVNEMGPDQQWSFGFKVLESEEPSEEWKKRGARRLLTKLDVFEVSPVMIGAGIGTRTVATKEADNAAKAALAQAEEERLAAQVAAQEAETKAAQEAIDQKVRAEAARDAMADFYRVQRSLKRMGVA
jgi:hypothetical protein